MRHTLWVFPETTTATLASVRERLEPVFCTVAVVGLFGAFVEDCCLFIYLFLTHSIHPQGEKNQLDKEHVRNTHPSCIQQISDTCDGVKMRTAIRIFGEIKGKVRKNLNY
jgi:hypothetical protein